MRRNSFPILVFLILVTIKSGAQSANIDTTVYYRLTTMWQGEEKSLDIANDNKKDHPWIAKTAEVSGQWWKFSPTTGGYYRITSMWLGDGKSLDIINDGTYNNRPGMGSTGPYAGQAWKLTELPDEYYRLTTNWQGDGKSLDIINDGKGNDQLWLNESAEYSGQYWKLTPGNKVLAYAIPEIDSSAFYQITNGWQSTKSLDIVNDQKKNHPWIDKTGPYSGQAWKITPVGDGYYRLSSQFLGTGMSLDIINDGKNNLPIMEKSNLYSGQLWKLTPIKDGYYRLTTQFQGDGKSLDVINDGKNNNQASLETTAEVSGQYWKLIKIQ